MKWPALLGKMGAVLLKNHGSVVAGAGIAEVCVTAHKLEKVAETMLTRGLSREAPLMSRGENRAISWLREKAWNPEACTGALAHAAGLLSRSLA